jgi:hypothetical protein
VIKYARTAWRFGGALAKMMNIKRLFVHYMYKKLQGFGVEISVFRKLANQLVGGIKENLLNLHGRKPGLPTDLVNKHSEE